MKFKLLDPNQIIESPSNPRKHRDPATDAELEASVRANGILEPVLVRRRRGANGTPTSVNAKHTYELVFGSRRLRAAIAVGLDAIPAMVGEIPDDQVLELQLVENAQRADVTALEEADAMAELVARHGRDAAAIADKLGRPVNFVRRRLLLSRLIPALRELLDAERIGIGSAERLAGLPLDSQTELVGDGGALNPAREAYSGERLRWSSYMVIAAIEDISRPLAKAQWDLDEEGLGGNPDCASCLRRTDAQTTLLGAGDVAARCLDGTCWASKQSAYVARRRREIADAGAELHEGDVAQQLLGQSWDPRRRYRPVTDIVDPKSDTTWGELAGDAPRTYALSGDGELVELVRIEDVAEELKEDPRPEAQELVEKIGKWTGKGATAPSEEKRRAQEEHERKRAEKLEAARAACADRVEQIARLVEAVEHFGFGAAAASMLELAHNEDVPFVEREEAMKLVAARRGWAWSEEDSLEAILADLDDEQRAGLYVEFLLAPWLEPLTGYCAAASGELFDRLMSLAPPLPTVTSEPEGVTPGHLREDLTSPEAADLYDLIRTGADVLPGRLEQHTVKVLREVLLALEGELRGARTKPDLVNALLSVSAERRGAKGAAW